MEGLSFELKLGANDKEMTQSELFKELLEKYETVKENTLGNYDDNHKEYTKLYGEISDYKVAWILAGAKQ